MTAQGLWWLCVCRCRSCRASVCELERMVHSLVFNEDEDFATANVETLRRKLWRFVGDVYLLIPSVLPLFPMSIQTLMLYTVWLNRNGINGMKSINNYISAAMAWQAQRGIPDTRTKSTLHEALWARFKRRCQTRLIPSVLHRPKMPLPASLLECLALQALIDAHVYLRWRDITMWVIAWFSGLRVGHWAPTSSRKVHVLRWCDVQIQSDKIMLFLRSTKTRAPLITHGAWTAVAARPDGLYTLDPRRLMLRWRQMSFVGDNSQPLFHGSAGAHVTMSRKEFTDRLRDQLLVAGERLGVDLDLGRYSGISFRKALAHGLWGHVEHHRLMDAMDHRSFTACMSYGGDSADARAQNTHVQARVFQPGL